MIKFLVIRDKIFDRRLLLKSVTHGNKLSWMLVASDSANVLKATRDSYLSRYKLGVRRFKAYKRWHRKNASILTLPVDTKITEQHLSGYFPDEFFVHQWFSDLKSAELYYEFI